jgi:hypothetical protein
MESRQKMLAITRDCVQAVLEALEFRLKITTAVRSIAEGGPFEVHHNLLGRNRILAMIAHNSDVLGLQHCLVVSLLSC